jgi:hypothetical protein
MAQQKGHYQPGQYGLNTDVLPDSGITYVSLSLNYNAGRLNFTNGTPVNARGTYNIWAVQNIFFYVPNFKIIGAKVAPVIAFPIIATGSLTLPFLGDGVTVQTGGFGLADTWCEPVNLGWHFVPDQPNLDYLGDRLGLQEWSIWRHSLTETPVVGERCNDCLELYTRFASQGLPKKFGPST